MKTEWYLKSTYHYFVLPLPPDIPNQAIDRLSEKIRSLPPNPLLTANQRRLIEIIVPYLYKAGLFGATVSIHQITDLVVRHFGDSEINHVGVGWIVDGMFTDSNQVTSGIYEVVRSEAGYRFQPNYSILPEVCQVIL